MIETFGLDTSALALDMTNFATYIDSTNDRAPIAQRQGQTETIRPAPGRAGPGRHPRRRVPLVSHAYPGNRPDVTQFATVIELLTARHGALTQASTDSGPTSSGSAPRSTATATAEMTVVFDAGQNSVANFAHLAQTGLHFVGSIPPVTAPTCSPHPPPTATSCTPSAFRG